MEWLDTTEAGVAFREWNAAVDASLSPPRLVRNQPREL
jgi:hypothetical protein